MPLFRSKAEDKVRAAGYDPARLPPGQYLTEKWPVLHAGEVAQVDVATWTLRLCGEVEEEVTLNYEQLRALPATEIGGILDQAFEIALRPGLHCAPYMHRALGTFPDGTVRVSPGPFNTEADIDRLAGALAEILV